MNFYFYLINNYLIISAPLHDQNSSDKEQHITVMYLDENGRYENEYTDRWGKKRKGFKWHIYPNRRRQRRQPSPVMLGVQ
jgi:hypothetical protein